MADSLLKILLKSVFDKKGVDDAQKGLGQLDKKAGTSVLTLAKLTAGAAAFGLAAKQAFDLGREGAQLQFAEEQFGKLAVSIGSTSDAILTQFGAATGGMVSNADMIASASQIISLGLADNQEDVVSLASLVSQLGWDMQQVILTFANNSKARLDALGLSVTDVEARMKLLEAQGYDTDKAFDLAVIEAGKAKLELLGSAADSAVGDFAVLQAQFKNLADEAKKSLANVVAPVVKALADSMSGVTSEPLDKAVISLAQATTNTREFVDALGAIGISGRQGSQILLNISNGAASNAREFREWAQSLIDANEALDADTVLLERHRRAQTASSESTVNYDTALRRVNRTIVEFGGSITGTAVPADEAFYQANWDTYESVVELQGVLQETSDFLGDAFVGSLQASTTEQVNWKNELLLSLDPMTTAKEEYILLAEATGMYSSAQIEAAIEAAAMKPKIEELAGQIAAGQISVRDAIDALREFRAEMGFQLGPVDAFIQKLREIPGRIVVEVVTVYGDAGAQTAHGGHQDPNNPGGPGRNSAPNYPTTPNAAAQNAYNSGGYVGAP